MKSKNFFTMVAVATAVLSVFYSCNRNDEISENELVTLESAAETSALTDNLFQEAMEEIDELTMLDGFNIQMPGTKSSFVSEGVSGNRNTNVSVNDEGTVIVVIDYDNFVNPRSRHARIKNGRMTVLLSGRPLGPDGFLRKIIFESFMVGPYRIEGTKVIERDPEIMYRYKITLTNGKVVFPDGGIMIREFERTVTWREGHGTPFYIWDDIYTVEGKGHGVSRHGERFTQEIIEPLVIRRDCRYRVSGIIEIKLGERQITIDYGNGECKDWIRLRTRQRTRNVNYSNDE